MMKIHVDVVRIILGNLYILRDWAIYKRFKAFMRTKHNIIREEKVYRIKEETNKTD